MTAAAGDVHSVFLALETAILGYGLLGPRLIDPAQRAQARTGELGHRNARDQLLQVASQIGAPYLASDPGAELPARVADDLAARLLAVQLEDAAAASWRALLASTLARSIDPDGAAGAAQLALTELGATAIRAFGWRVIDAPDAATTAFPGIG